MKAYTNKEIAEMLEIFKEYTSSLEEVYKTYLTDSNTVLEEESKKSELNKQLMEFGFDDNYSYLNDKFKIEGCGFFGVVISTPKYSDVVYKWYFSDSSSYVPSNLIDDSSLIGYNYLNNSNGICVPLELHKFMPIVFYNDNDGVLLDKVNVRNIGQVTDELTVDNSKIRHLAMYIKFLKEGFYVADYHKDNMEFNGYSPVMLDLDLFYYSEKLKQSFEKYIETPEFLYRVLKQLGIFSHIGNYLDEFVKAMEICIDVKPILSTNPLD